MKVTLRLFPSYNVNNQLEWNWQWSGIHNEALERYTTKSVAEFESFLAAWSSLIFRVETNNVHEPQVKEELIRKSTWLGNLLEWESLHLPESITELNFVSEGNWLTLPLEILAYKGEMLYPQFPIHRRAKTHKKPLPTKQGEKQLFFLPSTDSGRLQASLERERMALSQILQQGGDLVFLSGQQARKERLRELLPLASIFYLGSHLEQDNLLLPDGSRITAEELESWNLSGLKLAFLNGCYSGGKLAAAFLSAGCKEVIGYSFAVPNELAERNAITFWKCWSKTGSSLQAVQAVRDSLQDSIFKYVFIQYVATSDQANMLRSTPKKLLIALGFFLTLFTAYLFTIKLTKSKVSMKPQKTIGISQTIKEAEYQTLTPNKEPLKKQKHRVISKPNPINYAIKKNKHSTFSPKLQKTLSQIRDPVFKAKIIGFLKDDSHLLNKDERMNLISKILNSGFSENEKKEYFQFETGIAF
ncbi:MAG: CHAT domain-containing protein [Leptospiraceae bacterium]|nr:CHAT domain-containing protein [Leptospiraceae bacterium]